MLPAYFSFGHPGTREQLDSFPFRIFFFMLLFCCTLFEMGGCVEERVLLEINDNWDKWTRIVYLLVCLFH